jgi:ABC-type nitrate/sulfonate/bicarbonate transport system substrate-binding protein
VKKIFWCCLIFLTFCELAQAAEKIRIAVPEPNAAYLTFPLAYKKGFLANQGFAAEVISMRGTLTLPALNNGDIDYLTDISQGVRGV